jgi:hypothetical protein
MRTVDQVMILRMGLLSREHSTFRRRCHSGTVSQRQGG